MATKLVRLRNQLIQSFTTSSNASALKTKLNSMQETLNRITIPERFKGTIVEKWLMYWRGLCIDYRDVFIDVGKQIKQKPIRSSTYAGLAIATYYCHRRNPSEIEFINQLRLHNANMVLVNEICHNPESAKYLIFLERCYNEGIVRRLNVGVCSLLWLDDYDRALSLYKATCPYMKPDLFTWHQRIIDVGFFDKWWTLEEKMIDYDVNNANM